jgi:hypothetical protein
MAAPESRDSTMRTAFAVPTGVAEHQVTWVSPVEAQDGHDNCPTVSRRHHQKRPRAHKVWNEGEGGVSSWVTNPTGQSPS